MSLTTRLTLWQIAFCIVFLGGGFLVTWLIIDRVLDRKINEELVADAVEFRNIYAADGVQGLILEFQKEQTEHAGDAEFYRILRPGRHVEPIYSSHPFGLAESGEWPRLESIPSGHEVLLETNTRKLKDDDGEPTSIVFKEAIFALESDLAVHIGESTEQVSELVTITRNAFLVILLGLIPLAGILGRIVVTRAMKGVSEVSNTARQIQRGMLDERASVLHRDKEVYELSRAFNTMLDFIRDLITEMQEMTDNIAHDLKSPIARVRFMAEVVLSRNLSDEESKEYASKTILECDRLLKMIDLSLDVAEAEAGIKNTTREPVDLTRVVNGAYELFEPVSEDLGIQLRKSIEPNCVSFGNQAAMERMISNLVDNALKYSNSGDEVILSLFRRSGALVFEVSDTGVGISEQHLEDVFKRFFRCDRSRSREGCGLGLSFSRAIARQYGGDIEVQSAPGEGSVFTLWLPESGHRSKENVTKFGERTTLFPVEDATPHQV